MVLYISTIPLINVDSGIVTTTCTIVHVTTTCTIVHVTTTCTIVHVPCIIYGLDVVVFLIIFTVVISCQSMDAIVIMCQIYPPNNECI